MRRVREEIPALSKIKEILFKRVQEPRGNEKMAFKVDRSRILAFQRCPRERYLGYHLNGTGIQRKRKALPLQFGSAFHEGVGFILGNVDHALDAGVGVGCTWLEEQFAASTVQVEDQAAVDYGKEEQIALTEALVRGWWLFEGEYFLSQYEVIEVEKEGRAALVDGIELMFRPDSIVRDRESGDLYVISWKTCASYSDRNLKQARVDMQSISEVWGIQQTQGLKIEGVLYKYAVKGRRSKDKFDGLYKQDSHLIYGWKKLKGTEDEDNWSWKFKFEREDDPSKETTLGKGWQKVPIWREYPGGVKAWVEALSKNEIYPRHIDALQVVFPQSLPVERRGDEVEKWKRQTTAQEARVAESLDMVIPWADKSLDIHFPQHTAACSNFSGCSFHDICWNPEIGRDPIGSGLYEIRTANHPEDEEEE
jgi:PD-(D/E)XK nuclease superfamily